MKKILYVLVAGTVISGLCAFAAGGQTPDSTKLWRLDCGSTYIPDLNLFSDTRAYPGQGKALTASCYLIKHGDRYMLWDTGLPASMKGAKIDQKTGGATITKTIVEQLGELGIKPEQIEMIGISHYHYDHVGQAESFPGATLMIGKGDLDALSATPPDTMASLCSVNGSIRLPAVAAAITMPATIMIQVIAAAAARRSGTTPDASIASSDVPAAPTPAPIMLNARMTSNVPATGDAVSNIVPLTATIAPSARIPMPPMIHGVRLRPLSDPWPHIGRDSCTA